MRISTSMIYELGGTSVQAQQSGLFKLQQQLSSGKRVNTPSDDPLAAARVLEINQSKSVSEQLSVNGDYATSTLQAQESALGSFNDVLTQLKAQGVYAGNPSLTHEDRKILAADIRGKYAELLSLANTQENGKYLFSGFQGETQPFSETTPGVVAYNGDEGQRLIQVSPSRQVPVSSAGIEVFQRIKNGNGTFFVSGDPAVTGTTNTGTGVATPGSLLDATKWQAGSGDISVIFHVDSTVNPPVTTYDVVDNVSTNSLLTGAAPGPGPYPRTYTPGTAISLSQTAAPAFDLGAELSISGSPATGDKFTIKDSVPNQDIFSTVYNLIDALENTSGAQLSNHVMTFLQDLEKSSESVLTAITNVGSTLAEVEAHKNVSEDLVVQYKTSISHLEDLDYATAATDYALRQANLQAAQQSFIKVQGLSLFNFIQ